MTVQMEIDDELLNALKVIRKECRMHRECEGCFMAQDDCCMLERNPKEWKLEPRIVID